MSRMVGNLQGGEQARRLTLHRRPERNPRHGARALTSTCGTVDLLEAVGIDVACDVSTVEKSIHQVGIGRFNGMSPRIHPRARARILSQIRFGSTLNIAASLASPNIS